MDERNPSSTTSKVISSAPLVLRGIAVTVPAGVDDVRKHEEEWGTANLAKFIKMTGVEQRHLASQTPSNFPITAADLCCAAAERLFADLAIERNSVDAIVFVTQYPDYGGSPATACVLQHRLGLGAHVLAFDVNQGCTGYLYGLSIGAGLLNLDGMNRVLLLCGDARHKVNPEDRSQILLFGDAGSATLLDRSDTGQKLNFAFKTLGAGFKNLIIPAGGARHRDVPASLREHDENVRRTLYDAHMDGVAVFNFTLSEVPELIRAYCATLGLDLGAFDGIALHQANRFIIEQIGRKLGVSKEKLLLSITRYGNTSSASIPLTLCHHAEQNGSPGRNILLCGFGVGLTLAVSHLDTTGTRFLPIDICPEGWDDGF